MSTVELQLHLTWAISLQEKVHGHLKVSPELTWLISRREKRACSLSSFSCIYMGDFVGEKYAHGHCRVLSVFK